MSDVMTSSLGSLSMFVLCGWAIAYLLNRLGLRNPRLLFLGITGLCSVLLIEVESLPLYGYLRAIIGELSLTSLALLLAGLAARIMGQVPARNAGPEGVLLSVFATGSVLYPLALGFGPFDPYRLGYGSPALLYGLILLAAIFWIKGNRPVALLIPCAILVWRMGSFESTNLWDHLIDPWVYMASVAVVLRRVYSALGSRQGSGASPTGASP